MPLIIPSPPRRASNLHVRDNGLKKKHAETQPGQAFGIRRPGSFGARKGSESQCVSFLPIPRPALSYVEGLQPLGLSAAT